MNSFGSASKQFALCDLREVFSNRRRFRRDMLPDLDQVNSFYCPSGCAPFRGWVLLPRYEYDQLDHYSTSLQLNIGNTSNDDNVGTLKNLSIVQAKCVTRGVASDPNALYLIELTDGRGILDNEWFKFPITTMYNVRASAYPQTSGTTTYYSGSMNGGATPWTWSTMLQDMWTRMGTFLGAWPGLPSTPSGTPEGMYYQGVPAWSSMCAVLTYLGMTVICDLTQNSPYTIVSVGASDTALTTAQTTYLTNLEDDLEWLDVGAGRVPGTVVVLFRRRNSVFGTEETVRSDEYQWSTTPLYSISVSAPSEFTGATGTHYIWSDFTVGYDMNNTVVAADAATAATIAAERVQQYFDMYYSGTSGSMMQSYAGALPFTTGPLVDIVCWSQYRPDEPRQGWRTRIARGDLRGVYPRRVTKRAHHHNVWTT